MQKVRWHKPFKNKLKSHFQELLSLHPGKSRCRLCQMPLPTAGTQTLSSSSGTQEEGPER